MHATKLEPDVRRFLGVVNAVRDAGAAAASFERVGLVLSDRSNRPEWGLDAATFVFGNGSFLQLVAPADAGKAGGAMVRAFLDRRGEGCVAACFEVNDVHATAGRLEAAGVPLASPGQPSFGPPGSPWDVLSLEPGVTGGGLTQLVGFRDDLPGSRLTTPDMRLFTQVYAVSDLAAVRQTFQALGLAPWAEYCTDLWGLDTAVFRLGDDSNIEVVSPTDASSKVSAVVAKAIRDKGQGHYMTVLEARDVHDLARRLESDGVPTLGAPEPAPAESPWGPCQQLWIHPGATHGAFLEFVTLPAPTPGTPRLGGLSA
jgi:hypothetical protein